MRLVASIEFIKHYANCSQGKDIISFIYICINRYMFHYHHNIYYTRSVVKGFSEACQKFSTFHFSAIHWISVFNNLQLSATIPCSGVVSSLKGMFQLRYGGMILGTQIATSASGGKIDFKGIFLPGLCFFSWRIGHFNLLANGKFLYFLFYLGYIMLRSNQGSSRPALQWGASVPWCGTGDCRAEPPSQSQCLSIIHLL